MGNCCSTTSDGRKLSTRRSHGRTSTNSTSDEPALKPSGAGEQHIWDSSDAESGDAHVDFVFPPLGRSYAGRAPSASREPVAISYAELLAEPEGDDPASWAGNPEETKINIHGRTYSRWWVQEWRRVAAENPAMVRDGDPVPRDATGQTDPVLLDHIRLSKAELQQCFHVKNKAVFGSANELRANEIRASVRRFFLGSENELQRRFFLRSENAFFARLGGAQENISLREFMEAQVLLQSELLSSNPVSFRFTFQDVWQLRCCAFSPRSISRIIVQTCFRRVLIALAEQSVRTRRKHAWSIH